MFYARKYHLYRPAMAGRYVQPASAAFAPTDITGLVTWLDASDLTTLWQDSGRTTPVASDADPVGCVDDKSGNGDNYVQATAGARPTYKTGIQNSKSAILGDGTDDLLACATLPALTAMTLYIVCKHNGAAVASDCIFGSGTDVGVRINTGGTDWNVDSDAYAAENNFGSTPTNTNLLVVKAASTAACSIALNGGAFGSSFNPFDALLSDTARSVFANTLGAYCSAYFMEILMYDTALSAGNDASVRAYLNTKWAVY